MNPNKRIVAIVPIKKVSQRVPGKNFREFNGKPLWHHIIHTLDEALSDRDQIVVETDDGSTYHEATELSSKVSVIQREEHLLGNGVSMNAILEHALEQTYGDIYLQTHVTNPLLKATTILKALLAFNLMDPRYDSMFGVTKHQSRFYRTPDEPINHDPVILMQTQDLLPLYEENSTLYIFTKQSFAQDKRRIGRCPAMFAVPKIEAIDIDDEETFEMAELLAKASAK